MKLYPATLADLPAMASVHAQAFVAPWDEAAFAMFFTGSGAYAVMAAAEDPAGVVLCRALAGEAEVLTLAVAPWARRRGLGADLMRAAIATARAAAAASMFLEVDVANVAAVGLYGRLGFARAGLRRAYYDRGPGGRADALVMRLDLTNADQ